MGGILSVPPMPISASAVASQNILVFATFSVEAPDLMSLTANFFGKQSGEGQIWGLGDHTQFKWSGGLGCDLRRCGRNSARA